MAKIICLKGKQGSGKTTTLNILIDALQSFSDKYCVEKLWNGVREKDRRAYFDINGARIGICTAGDDCEIIEENKDFFENNKCTIWILAVRTEPQCENAYKNLVLTENNKIFEGKMDKRNNLNECNSKAIEILKKILEEIYL